MLLVHAREMLASLVGDKVSSLKVVCQRVGLFSLMRQHLNDLWHVCLEALTARRNINHSASYRAASKHL